MAKTVPTKRLHRTNARREHVVDRAEALLAGFLGEPIATEDLCAAIGVSENTLHNAFRLVHGVTPGHYMLRERLGRVHEALENGEYPYVAAAATEYGFFDSGLFATCYKQQFGEYPSDTLRNARARNDVN
jgi:AraC family ethanolamine operon transcriptional activator